MGFKARGASYELLRTHLPTFCKPGRLLLEVGPGSQRRSLVRKTAQPLEMTYHFCDLNNRDPDHPGFVPMKGQFEIVVESGTFDVVVLSQMLHNARKPWRLFPEIARVLKPGGVLFCIDSLCENANFWPKDCGRIFPDGMRCLYDEAGLKEAGFKILREDGTYVGLDERWGDVFGERLLSVAIKPGGPGWEHPGNLI